MDSNQLLTLLAAGEDSSHQFKTMAHSSEAIAAEMVAMSNASGGKLIIGVEDNGQVKGLTSEEVQKVNQLISNAASNSVRPAINPHTENVLFPEGVVIVITIPSGLNKPYMDAQGTVWIKNRADKRRVTAREELQRMYQSAALLHADEVPVASMTIDDLDKEYFSAFYEKQFGTPLEEQELPLPIILQNMNLMKEGALNLAGALLFGKSVQFKLPTFGVKAISYPGTDIHVTEYKDSEDIYGKIEEVFERSLAFILRHLRRIQGEQGVNSLGILEVPRIALEEVLVNALVHRDYFISATVKIFLFDDRIEIVSPGHLPNNLSIEHIKRGNSNIRNPILASFATKILLYRGLGNGIRRALKEYPKIDFQDERSLNEFRVTFWRP